MAGRSLMQDMKLQKMWRLQTAFDMRLIGRVLSVRTICGVPCTRVYQPEGTKILVFEAECITCELSRHFYCLAGMFSASDGPLIHLKLLIDSALFFSGMLFIKLRCRTTDQFSS